MVQPRLPYKQGTRVWMPDQEPRLMIQLPKGQVIVPNLDTYLHHLTRLVQWLINREDDRTWALADLRERLSPLAQTLPQDLENEPKAAGRKIVQSLTPFLEDRVSGFPAKSLPPTESRGYLGFLRETNLAEWVAELDPLNGK